MGRILTVIVLTSVTCLGSGCKPKTPRVTEAQAQSGKYQAYQEFLSRPVPRASVSGLHDSLSDYAAKCDAATAIHVPAFSCDAGTEVPGQGSIPATVRNATHCDQPNVLNGHCDPGSKFQVLPGGTADAVAVAHCRKVGRPIGDSTYNDVAVIQYNKQNGAVCFYQALGDDVSGPLPSQFPEPSAGQAGSRWISPQGTESIGCTGCHDNGGFIRSEYLAQLRTPPNVLPNTAAGFTNFDSPLRYVGLDFETNRSWSITAPPGSGDTGPVCTSCHRLAVPNIQAFGMINGSAAHFANIATAASQDSKNPHGPSSPIWMRLNQVTYQPAAEASATKFHDCAVGFFNSGFASAPAGCTVTPLGDTWSPPVDGASFVSQTPAPTGTLTPLSTFNETVTFMNSGGIPWVGSHTMSIVAVSQSGAQIFPPQSFAMGSAQAPIVPGQSVPETFAVRAPGQPGTYDLAFVLKGPLGQVFAATPTQQIVVAAPNTAADNATLTIVSAPGSLTNGASATVTVRAVNTGSTTWSSPGYALALGRGLRLSLPQFSASIAGTVPPAASQDLTFDVKCNGQGQGFFTAQMAASQGGVFGQRVAKTIVCQP